ncbi:MAG: hypothetical protein PVJ02_06900, partial [Gemmatimonadota bacterium]
PERRAGARWGRMASDVLLALAVLSVILALAYPWLARIRFQSRVDAAVSDVEAVRSAALRYFDVKDGWPPEGEPGSAPTELAPFLPAGLSMARAPYRLQWNRWETVRPPSPVVPPQRPPNLEVPSVAASLPSPEPRFLAVAGITIHASDPSLLAALQAHYGPDRSLVRDSTWTLVLQAR